MPRHERGNGLGMERAISHRDFLNGAGVALRGSHDG